MKLQCSKCDVATAAGLTWSPLGWSGEKGGQLSGRITTFYFLGFFSSLIKMSIDHLVGRCKVTARRTSHMVKVSSWLRSVKQSFLFVLRNWIGFEFINSLKGFRSKAVNSLVLLMYTECILGGWKITLFLRNIAIFKKFFLYIKHNKSWKKLVVICRVLLKCEFIYYVKYCWL